MGALKQAALEEMDEIVDTSDESSEVQTMVRWFLARYEDPAENCSKADGEYVFPNGSADPEDVLHEEFEDKIDREDIDRAAELLLDVALEWAVKPKAAGPDDPDEEDDFPDDEEGDFDPDAEED